MTKDFYLVIEGRKGRYYGARIADFGVRILTTKPNLNNNEIAVLLRLDVPKEFFERMIPVAELKLPKEAILTLDEATIVSLTSQELSEKLKISLEDAEDGLKQMLSKKKENLE